MASRIDIFFVFLKFDSKTRAERSLLYNRNMLPNFGAETGLESLQGNVISAVWANVPLVAQSKCLIFGFVA